VLAVACDRRILSAETQIGATELQVGVPFPVSALEVLRHGCGVHADDVVLGAALHTGPEAVRLGLAHEIVDNDRVVPRALEVAHALAAVAPAAYRHAKHQLRAPVLARIAAERPRADAEVIAGWVSPATLDRLRAQIARMSRRT
jgi:enoyl-CoA hydratase/carnithine racemase